MRTGVTNRTESDREHSAAGANAARLATKLRSCGGLERALRVIENARVNR